MFYKLRENAYPNVKIYILRFHAVHPHILYGTEIYANTQAYLSWKINKLNNKFLRMLQNQPITNSCVYCVPNKTRDHIFDDKLK